LGATLGIWAVEPRLLGDDAVPGHSDVGFVYEWKKGALDWEWSREVRTVSVIEGVFEEGFVTTSLDKLDQLVQTGRCGRHVRPGVLRGSR